MKDRKVYVWIEDIVTGGVCCAKELDIYNDLNFLEEAGIPSATSLDDALCAYANDYMAYYFQPRWTKCI